MSVRVIFANGLNFSLTPSASTTGICGAQTALEAFAPVDPAVKRRERPLQRFHFTNPATRIGIGEPQFTICILAAQRLFLRRDRANVAQAQSCDQRIAMGERLLKQPAGVEKDHGDRRIDIGHDLEQCRGFDAEGRNQRQPLATNHAQGALDHFRWGRVTKHGVERFGFFGRRKVLAYLLSKRFH